MAVLSIELVYYWQMMECILYTDKKTLKSKIEIKYNIEIKNLFDCVPHIPQMNGLKRKRVRHVAICQNARSNVGDCAAVLSLNW